MVAIKGMKMPESCIDCPFVKAEGTKFFCSRIMKYIDKNNLENKHDDCPLVEIVTCKDCKSNKNSTCMMDGLGVADDYFCASAFCVNARGECGECNLSEKLTGSESEDE